jgi:CRP/FNR family transcriptional regulator, dissimilatory nitrate respiration regulator
MVLKLDEQDRSALRATPLFRGLDETTLSNLLKGARVSSHRRGEVLFLQGDPVTSFYVVLDGWVKVFRTTQAGEEAIVGVFHRGQSFAEAAAFTEGVYPASGETASDTRLLCISARNLVGQLKDSPEIGLAMLASTSQHLNLLVRQIEELKAHTGPQRVAGFLLSMAPVESGPCTIAIPYDKALLAGKLGMKPESLSRAFQRLKGCGVSIRRDMAIVNDVECLRELIEQDRADVMRSRA